MAASVLKKKLSRIQTRGYIFPIQSTLAAKLEYAAAKGATEALKVTVEAIVESSRVDRLGYLIDTLPMPGLFFVMQAGSGETALISIDMRLVDHVVDILAGGDPNNPGNLPARTPTSIDAAFCTPVIDSIIAQFYGEVRALASDVALERFQIGRVEHMPTNLQYMLSDQQYLSCRVNLDIGEDARTGDFHLALPLAWIEPVEDALRRTGFSSAQNESEIWSRHMRKVARLTPFKINAVIDRGPMQVSDLVRLKVGNLLPLSDVSLNDVVLMLQSGGDSSPIGRGRLGIHKRNKAIRIIEPPSREFLEPLANLLAVEMDHE